MIDIYKSVANVEKFIYNVAEFMAVIYIYFRILFLRVNISSFGEIYSQVFKDYNVSDFKNSEEIEVFMQFINKDIFLLRGFVSITRVDFF